LKFCSRNICRKLLLKYSYAIKVEIRLQELLGNLWNRKHVILWQAYMNAHMQDHTAMGIHISWYRELRENNENMEADS